MKLKAFMVLGVLTALMTGACESSADAPAAGMEPADAADSAASSSAERKSARAPDGVEIVYDIAGEGEPAIVFVHGWSCDRSYWREQFDHFAAEQRVVAIDLAGHGESGRDRTEWSMAAFGADVTAVVENAGVEKAVLVGHSMGGPVIVEAARLMPERVAAVIPVDYFQDVGNPMTSEQIDAFVAPLREDFASDAYDFARSMFGPHADTDRADRVARDMASAPPEIALPAIRETLAYDSAAGLRAIDAPVWVINADLWPTDLVALREANEDIQLAVMPAAGHFVMMDYPEEFNGLLSRAVRETTD